MGRFVAGMFVAGITLGLWGTFAGTLFGADAGGLLNVNTNAANSGGLGNPGNGTGSVTILSRDANSRLIQNLTQVTDDLGNLSVVTNQYLEMASGMHVMQGGQWVPASEVIQSFPGGAVATNGQNQVIFSTDAADPRGTVDLLSLDQQRFVSQPVGLIYYDYAANRAVTLALLTNSMGQLVANAAGVVNQVVYPNAFNGLACDLVYTYHLGSFSQDLILQEAPPDPSLWGLSPTTTTLEVVTEFLQAPTPVVQTNLVAGNALADQQLDFGELKFLAGGTFSTAGGSAVTAPTFKRWQMVSGHIVLIEDTAYSAVKRSLAALPQSKSRRTKMAQNGFVWPGRKVAQARREPMRVVRAKPPGPSLVMDYVTVSGTFSNYVFAAGTTYYVSGAVTLAGANSVFEGGSVIKFVPSASNAVLTVTTPITWNATAYHPVVMTARDDNTVGDTISGSSGSPSGYYANPALSVNYSSTGNAAVNIAYLRVSYENVGLSIQNNASTNPFVLSHSQFVNCNQGCSVTDGAFIGRNVLWNNVQTAVYSTYSALSGEHWTADALNNLVVDVVPGTPSTLSLTNSLLTAVTNIGVSGGNYTTNGVVSLSSASGVYQTVGAGSHYLASGSAYVAAGTANINPGLAADLTNMTVFPPQVATNAITTNTVWSPQAARDTGAPSLGWHYAALDYLASGVGITNTSLCLTNGVAVGFYGSYGFVLGHSGALVSQGTPLSLDRMTFYPSVQEQSTALGSSASAMINANATSAPYPSMFFRFTDFAGTAGGQKTLLPANPNFTSLAIVDSQMRGITMNSYPITSGVVATEALTNNILERCTLTFQKYYQTVSLVFYAYNNLFWQGSLSLDYYSASGDTNAPNWGLYDNLFDAVTQTESDNNSGGYINTYVLNSHNGYNGTTHLSMSGGGDVSLSGFTYQIGPLSVYYQLASSSLLNAGSRLASAAGLYHYTVLTNEVKETNSTVDIGVHFVALNASGQPDDSDGDGIPDYLENRAGNGSYTAGVDLSDWQNPDTAYDGVTDLAEWQAGQNPASPANPPQVRMGYWRFNTNTWVGEEGQLPMQATNVVSVPGASGTALLVDAPFWEQAGVRYHDVDQINGQAQLNFNLKCGSISMWVLPTWTSTNLGGTGPYYDYGRLFEAGYFGTNGGWFGLIVDSGGNNLIFGASSNATVNYPVNYPVVAPISWTSNQWYQVVLIYTPTNSFIYVNGVLAASGTGVTNYYPNAATRAYGGVVGADGQMQEQLFAAIDELQTYNYPLSSNTVYWNYTTNNPTLDTDYDSVSDVQERLEGTDPYNPASVNGRRLGYWRFNTTNWPGEEGQIPMQATNLASAPGVSGTAMLVDGPFWEAAGVRYHDVEPNGQVNFNLRCGSIRLWVLPTWTSTNLGGTGPYYDYGRLFEAGYWGGSGGWFALHVDSGGNTLILGASSNAAVNYPVNYPVTAPISWFSNQWYQVVLTYTPTNSFLYVNGSLAASGTGITNYYPTLASRQLGGVVGADGAMGEQIFAALDELETFNYPLSSNDVYWNYTTNNPTLDTDYDGVSDVQERLEGTDPYNPASVNGRRLGYWRFNTTNWLGEQGQLPMVISNVASGPGISSNALVCNPPSGILGLSYHDVEAKGQINFNFRCGSIRFWFNPSWTSTGAGGSGPGSYDAFLECGNFSWPPTNGMFAFYLAPDGNSIGVQASTNGTYLVPVAANTSGWVSNNWYQIALTYTSTNSAIYINGQVAATGSGVTVWANAAIRSQGIEVGTGYAFWGAMGGSMDELETFNFPLTANQVLTDYQFVQGLPTGGGGASDPALGLQVFTPLK